MENNVLDKVRAEGHYRLARPFQLVSLLDMIKFKAREFLQLAQYLKWAETIIEEAKRTRPEAKDEITDETKPILTEKLDAMIGMCKDIGLELSVMLLEEIRDAVNNTPAYDFHNFAEDIRQLERRVDHEMSLPLFMVISRSRVGFYEQPALFGPEVAAKFPSATFDIEEAGNCYATGRNTACVMHLMRVMELGLKAVAAALAIPDPDQANWQRIIDQINAQINQRKTSKTPNWLAVEPFFCDVSANLFAVKVAWRNPSMHLESKYDEQEARRIYNAVEGFMQHIARRLDESGQFTP